MLIPEIQLVPHPETPEAARVLGFRWAPGEVGKRHKLGGEPQWIADAQWPSCSQCGTVMTFYGQLDSVGDEVTLADCGMVYVFVCFGCFETASVLQTT